jgi:hypothetical protein
LFDAFARLSDREVVFERENNRGLEVERLRHRLRDRRLGLGNHAKRESGERDDR